MILYPVALYIDTRALIFLISHEAYSGGNPLLHLNPPSGCYWIRINHAWRTPLTPSGLSLFSALFQTPPTPSAPDSTTIMLP